MMFGDYHYSYIIDGEYIITNRVTGKEVARCNSSGIDMILKRALDEAYSLSQLYNDV